MRSNIGLETLENESLYDWRCIFREDAKTCSAEVGIGYKARAWAMQTCTKIVLILARKNYDPKTKKPPRSLVNVAAAQESTFQETHQS